MILSCVLKSEFDNNSSAFDTCSVRMLELGINSESFHFLVHSTPLRVSSHGVGASCSINFFTSASFPRMGVGVSTETLSLEVEEDSFYSDSSTVCEATGYSGKTSSKL